jgi:hypothetical protein
MRPRIKIGFHTSRGAQEASSLNIRKWKNTAQTSRNPRLALLMDTRNRAQISGESIQSEEAKKANTGTISLDVTL